MLTLVTGQPGNGKTLYTLATVEALRKVSNRPVYQHGIARLALPWLELKDAHAWYECPEASIIVIDEAWRAFPVRKQGAAVPQYVEEFATHRHRGFDVYLVTQHRHQVDTFVRKMVGRHIHVVRKFGAERATVFQWEKETDVDSTSARESALKEGWDYPKEAYEWYRSAEVHTVKKDFPWGRFWWIPVLVSVVAVMIYVSVQRFRHPQALPVAGGGQGAGTVPVRLLSATFFSTEARSARDRVSPWSAPRYDGAWKVVTVPWVTGCIDLQVGHERRCECTDQAGAVLVDLPLGLCVSMVKRGWFDATRKYSDSKAVNIAYLEARDRSGVSDGAGGGSGGGGSSPPASGGAVAATEPARTAGSAPGAP